MRFPAFFKSWMSWAIHVNGPSSSLPIRWKELVFLRTGWLLNTQYLWNQHVKIARRDADFTEADFRAVEVGPDTPYWSETDACVLRMVDELRFDACVSTKTWTGMERFFSLKQRIDLVAAAQWPAQAAQ